MCYWGSSWSQSFTVRTNHDSSGSYLILERSDSNRTNQSLDFIFRTATQVGAAQARGRAQKVAWRPFRPAIDFFLSFEQSGLRNRGKWRLRRIMICPNRDSFDWLIFAHLLTPQGFSRGHYPHDRRIQHETKRNH